MSDPILSPGHQHHLELRSQRIQQLNACLCSWHPEPTALTLEIGCGHGHFLTAYAQEHVESNCLGLDLVTKRIERALRKRNKRNVLHLQFLKAEITEFVAAFPDHLTLDRVFVLFPDPWPKKRHIKNRIIQPKLLDWIASRGTSTTCLHVRSDHEVAFAWAFEQIASHADWEIDDTMDWPFEHGSFFQDMMADYFSLSARRVPSPASDSALCS